MLADWAAIAIENARLYRESVAARRVELERAVEGLEATTEIARALGSETDLERVLELIVKRGRALVEARTVVMLLLEGDRLVVGGRRRPARVAHRGRTLSAGRPVAGEVLRSGRPERIADVSVRLGLHDEQLGIAGAETALLVPLRYRQRRARRAVRLRPARRRRPSSATRRGAAAVVRRERRDRGRDRKSVEAERLRHSARRSAEQERSRWARELHDETLQGLAALGVLLASGLRAGGRRRSSRRRGTRPSSCRPRSPTCAR